MKISIKNVQLKKKINIKDVKLGLKKVYPELEDLEITPISIEQNFKSNKYGYNNVKVRAVESNNLEITPTLEEQEYVGLYGKVNVNPATEVYDNGYEEGKNSVVQLEKYATVMKFRNLNLFGTKELIINFEVLKDFTEMFYAPNTDEQWKQNTTVEHIILNTKEKATNMYRMFGNSSYAQADMTLKHITFNFELDTEYTNGVNMNNIFQNARGIEIIDGTPLNVSSVKTFNSSFNQCNALCEIRFVECTIKNNIGFAQSTKLSNETIENIIKGLADLTDSETKTLTLHATVKEKLTDEQIASITAKNWTLA